MNETWSELKTDDVMGQFTAVEQAVLKNIGGADKLAGIVQGVIDQVRKAYLDGGRGVDAASDSSIPDGEKNRAIAIARWKLLISFPALKSMQTADRKTAHDDAQTYFLEVSSRKQTGEGGSQVISSQTRRATRDKFEGLI
jgi:hypothetical protein